MDEYLWPARNVAEHAYCPRLFYYMQVEGVFVPSSDTEKGLVVHRRVDRPSAASTAQKNDEEVDAEKPEIVRSLVLTSDSLKLTATLDLAEISGQTAVPVEYRKGRSKRITMSPVSPEETGDPPPSYSRIWPTDRAQVGLQVILLEEAGYKVEEAIVYYATEKLSLRISINDAFKAEALKTFENAKQCAEGPRPLPLVNDPRCPRCSLQPICLPDEVNYQQSPTDEMTPRKLWPPRDDGIHIVAQQDGVKIGVRGKELRVTNRDGIVAKTMPLANLESLSLLGAVQITTQAINRQNPHGFLSNNNDVSLLFRKGLADNCCRFAGFCLIKAKIKNDDLVVFLVHLLLKIAL